MFSDRTISSGGAASAAAVGIAEAAAQARAAAFQHFVGRIINLPSCLISFPSFKRKM